MRKVLGAGTYVVDEVGDYRRKKVKFTSSTRVPAGRSDTKNFVSLILARFMGRRARETVEGGFFENIQREVSEESNWGLSAAVKDDSYLTFSKNIVGDDRLIGDAFGRTTRILWSRNRMLRTWMRKSQS